MTSAQCLAPGSRAVVARYRRINPWIPIADLTQEASLSALEASRTNKSQWEIRLVAIALSRFVAEARCPVSLPKHKGESWQAASGTRRSPLQVTSEGGEQIESHALAQVASEQFTPLEDVLDRERAMASVRRILDEESEAARAVLLAEEKSAEVARRLGLSVRDVYEQTAAAVRSLRASLCPEAALL